MASWEDAVDALVNEPDLRQPMREQLGKSPRERDLAKLLDNLEYVDPQTPEGQAALAEREASAARWAQTRRADEQRSSMRFSVARARNRVKAAKDRVAQTLKRREQDAEQAPTGGWGRW